MVRGLKPTANIGGRYATNCAQIVLFPWSPPPGQPGCGEESRERRTRLCTSSSGWGLQAGAAAVGGQANFLAAPFPPGTGCLTFRWNDVSFTVSTSNGDSPQEIAWHYPKLSKRWQPANES